MNATAAQINYINNLREDKDFMAEFTDEEVRTSAEQHARDPQAFIAQFNRGRAAYERGTENLTKDEASQIINALKAW